MAVHIATAEALQSGKHLDFPDRPPLQTSGNVEGLRAIASTRIAFGECEFDANRVQK